MKTLRAVGVGTLVGMWMMGAGVMAQGGCLNLEQFPEFITTPNANGTVTPISTCVFAGEYSHIGGIIPGANYEFVVSGNSYITLRTGTPGGPVVAQGTGVLQYQAVTAEPIFAHYNLSATCGTASSCLTNTVQLLLNCTPLTVNFGFELDCDNLAYFVVVNVESLGDANNVDIENDGGAPAITGVGLGSYTVGPFPNLSPVQIFVRHTGDVACSVLSPVLVNTPCPIVSCGPDNYNYCYGNNENTLFTYQSASSLPLAMLFNAGTLPTFGDVITIYDGQDDTAPVLFTGTNNGNMAGVLVISTNPDNALTMRLTSNAGTSCQDGGFDALDWTVQCLECVRPEAEYEIVQDCANFQFFVNVVVTAMGSNPDLVIVNDGAADEVVANEPGTYQVGPFVSGVPVQIFLLDVLDDLCTVVSPVLVNPICPLPVTCGAPPVSETYCYTANENRAWAYTSDGGGSLRLTFLRGTIESSTWDRIRIYDGPDNTAPVLFEHVLSTTYNLGPVGSAVNNALTTYYGIDVFATGNDLFMELTSDGSVQCEASTTFDPFEWEVVCLDCQLPVAGATVVDDCAAGTFTIPVTIGSTGSGSTVSVVYSVDEGPVFTVPDLGVGQTVIGPFNFGETVNVVVAHENNALCNVELGDLTDTGFCPELVICGEELNVVFCEGNNENAFFYYQGVGSFPLALTFNSGVLEACCDRLRVYDGADDTAPLLTPAAGIGGDLTGLFFLASNPENRLTVRITSDGSVSCGSGSNAPLDWTLSCLDCIPPTASFEIVQDCANFQYFVDVVVTSLGSDDVLDVGYINNGDTLATTISAPGTLQLGPFVSGTTTQVLLVNDANSLCNVSSGNLVNPLCPTIICGATALEEQYCYVANDNRAWAYELPTAGTLRLTFLRGTIESNTFDRIRIYDGADNTAPLLFQHTNTATWNLGPTGSAVNNTITNFYAVDVTATGSNLYMEMTSDGSVQCASSTTYDAWEWIVFCEGCQIPGVTYNAVPTCTDRTFVMEVNASNVGAQGLQVTNVFTGQQQVANAAGTLTFGPYDLDTPVAFELVGLDNPTCSFFSDTLTYASADCVVRSCGVDNYTYCYGNNEDRWYTFGAPINVPVTVSFLEGQMMSGDRIVVYNGGNENAPVLYQGNNGGNLTGFAVNSQNPANLITLRIQSNGSGSCADGGVAASMRWDVACGAVGIEENGAALFLAYPNPTADLLNIDLGGKSYGNVVLKLIDLSGRTVLQEQFAVEGGLHQVNVEKLVSGQYLLQLSTNEWIRTTQVQVMR